MNNWQKSATLSVAVGIAVVANPLQVEAFSQNEEAADELKENCIETSSDASVGNDEVQQVGDVENRTTPVNEVLEVNEEVDEADEVNEANEVNEKEIIVEQFDNDEYFQKSIINYPSVAAQSGKMEEAASQNIVFVAETSADDSRLSEQQLHQSENETENYDPEVIDEFDIEDSFEESIDDSLQISGEGTVENPYVISSENDLNVFRDSVNKNFKDYAGKYFTQNANITLTKEWIPIGGFDTFFSGIYDGQNFSIAHMVINNSTCASDGYIYSAGLFGAVSNNAVLRNIRLTDANIKLDISSDEVVAGILVGEIKNYPYDNNATIDHCDVSGTISVTGKGDQSIGGLVGKTSSLTTISNNNVQVEIDIGGTSGTKNIGGIVGNSKDSSILNNSFVGSQEVLDFSEPEQEVISGGIVGSAENSTIYNNYYKIQGVDGETGTSENSDCLSNYHKTSDLSNDSILNQLRYNISEEGKNEAESTKAGIYKKIDEIEDYYDWIIVGENAIISSEKYKVDSKEDSGNEEPAEEEKPKEEPKTDPSEEEPAEEEKPKEEPKTDPSEEESTEEERPKEEPKTDPSEEEPTEEEKPKEEPKTGPGEGESTEGTSKEEQIVRPSENNTDNSNDMPKTGQESQGQSSAISTSTESQGASENGSNNQPGIIDVGFVEGPTTPAEAINNNAEGALVPGNNVDGNDAKQVDNQSEANVNANETEDDASTNNNGSTIDNANDVKTIEEEKTPTTGRKKNGNVGKAFTVMVVTVFVVTIITITGILKNRINRRN